MFAIVLSMATLDPFTSTITLPLAMLTALISVPTVNPSSVRNFLTSSLPEMLTMTPLSPIFIMEMGTPDAGTEGSSARASHLASLALTYASAGFTQGGHICPI